MVQDLQECSVIAVQEMEGKELVWEDLEAALEALTATNWEWDYWESWDFRDITVGIYYNADRVTFVDSYQEQLCQTINTGIQWSNVQSPRSYYGSDPCTGGTYPAFSRPPYVARLQVDGGPEFHLIVNHFKSKGTSSYCSTPDCTDRRELQAGHIAYLLDWYTDSANGGIPNIAVVGDLNDYINSSPIAIIDAATTHDGQPVVNLLASHVSKDDRYTYIYNGQSQVLDYVYLSQAFEDYLQAASPMHINADFPYVDPLGDDNCAGGTCPLGGQPQDDTSRHSSDHDPVFVRMGVTPTAVKLLSFTGRPGLSGGQIGILLAWETASEHDNAGFNLYRSTTLDAPGVQLNETLIPSKSPGSDQGAAYAFLDATAQTGVVYYYTLEDVDLYGNRTVHGPVTAVLWRAYLPLVRR
jgi:hypothetical protein